MKRAHNSHSFPSFSRPFSSILITTAVNSPLRCRIPTNPDRHKKRTLIHLLEMLVQTLTDKEDSEESTQLLDKPKEVLLARITRFLKHPDIKHDHIATLQGAVTPSKMPYLDNIDARLETLTHMRHHLDTQIRKSPLKYGGIDLRLVSKLTWALNMIAPMEVIREAHDAVEDGIDDEEVDIGWVVNWGVCGNDILLEAIRMFFPNPDNHSFDQLFVCCDTDRSQIDALPMSDIDLAQMRISMISKHV
ncbi:hypothetical protein BDP81DRAFT_513075 [Colletotrichum phormii]|uniref:Uncharacterized protein n=1 Tax=Colletotrichum phormii TaxID=359342 RepID=A0AAI9ZXF7_9PEZI|nr:uncharacterized protein BDP81DRAFT_513075 [Colletotrichum phormii]KAK1639995.1 hypothetical protein BDP81DRAFT_513075 [Colletotrichum phormii]